MWANVSDRDTDPIIPIRSLKQQISWLFLDFFNKNKMSCPFPKIKQIRYTLQNVQNKTGVPFSKDQTKWSLGGSPTTVGQIFPDAQLRSCMKGFRHGKPSNRLRSNQKT